MQRVFARGVVVFVLAGVIPSVWADGAGNLTKTDDQSTAQTAKVLWTPASGKLIVLDGCAFSGGLADNKVKVQSGGVDVIPNQSTVQSATVSIVGGLSPLWVGTPDATLTYTTTNVSASARTTVMCWGREQTP